ncbi:MAG: DJ-1/PfpI family protein [Pseudomonadaceae bacterium]|nr:DJ-1/PfpI family protein [Pseudomonadaceae bacterium]
MHTIDTSKPLSVGVALYDNVEMLDTFGPLEMLSMLGAERCEIHMLSEHGGLIACAMGASGAFGPKIDSKPFAATPSLDLLLVPGGFGTFVEIDNSAFLDFLKERDADTPIIASVCTGSALLAKAGLLDGLAATSN